MAIRLATFDALHTLVAPRRPVYEQYSEIFAPFLGTLAPDALKHAFAASLSFHALSLSATPNPRAGLKHAQTTRPAYRPHPAGRWAQVVQRTAIGAGADPQAVAASIDLIVPRLMARFSSRDGYKLFDDTLPVLQHLRRINIRTALISNTDARMREWPMHTYAPRCLYLAGSVLDDLGVAPLLEPLLLGEEVGIEKPDPDIFRMACRSQGCGSVTLHESVHIGDDLHR